jgi:flavin-binding protein dodecin
VAEDVQAKGFQQHIDDALQRAARAADDVQQQAVILQGQAGAAGLKTCGAPR